MPLLESALLPYAELLALGFDQSLEGRIERELLRRLGADPVLAAYFTGGIYSIEAEEMADEAGLQTRTARLSMTMMAEDVQVGELSYFKTSWLLGLVTDRQPSGIGTGMQHRFVIVRRCKQAILGDNRGVMRDVLGDGERMTEALLSWEAGVTKPQPLPGGSLYLTMIPFALGSNIDSVSQEFIP